MSAGRRCSSGRHADLHNCKLKLNIKPRLDYSEKIQRNSTRLGSLREFPYAIGGTAVEYPG